MKFVLLTRWKGNKHSCTAKKMRGPISTSNSESKHGGYLRTFIRPQNFLVYTYCSHVVSVGMLVLLVSPFRHGPGHGGGAEPSSPEPNAI